MVQMKSLWLSFVKPMREGAFSPLPSFVKRDGGIYRHDGMITILGKRDV